MSDILRAKEAAALLHVSLKTLYRSTAPWFPIGSGRVRPTRRYFREELLQWAKQREAA